MQPATAKPLYIRMHADDNVAIVANRGGLYPGAEFSCGLRLIEQIPQGHKVALADIGQGESIRRYGEVIGHAAAPIAKGSWVKEALVQMPDAPSFDNLPTPNGGAIRLPPLEGYTFEGYRNADGSVGTRNILAISTSVQCVAGTVEFALDRIRKELLPKYPNVDDVVAITHAYGCGVTINAPGAAVPIRTLQNLAVAANDFALSDIGKGYLVALRDLLDQPQTAGELRVGMKAAAVRDDRDVIVRMHADVERFRGDGLHVESLFTDGIRPRVTARLDRGKQRQTARLIKRPFGQKAGG